MSTVPWITDARWQTLIGICRALDSRQGEGERHTENDAPRRATIKRRQEVGNGASTTIGVENEVTPALRQQPGVVASPSDPGASNGER